MPPQVDSPEASDRPTKLKMASTTIATPISSVTSVISSGTTLGNISLAKIRSGDRPSIRAEVT